MNPKSSLDWMQAALDGELSLGARAQFERQLTDSPAAQSQWAALIEVDQLLHTAPMAAPRPGFSRRFQERLAKRRPPTKIWGVMALGLAGPTGVVGMVTTALFVVGHLLNWTLRLPNPTSLATALVTEFAIRLADLQTIFSALKTSAYVLGNWAFSHPLLWLAIIPSLAIVTVWLYFIRKLTLTWEVPVL